MAVNVVLILTTVIFAVLVIIGGLYFLVYFQHPDDKWVAWFPKFIVVIGIALACYNIFLLPLDVANQQGAFQAAGGIPMFQINLIFFIATIVLGTVLVPFVMFYYEGVDDSDDEGDKTTTGSQIMYAFKWVVPTLLVFAIIDYVLWAYLGFVNVKFTVLKGSLVPGDQIVQSAPYCPNSTACSSTPSNQNIQVSPIISTVAFATLIGWLLFAFFGGVGLVALPVDLLLEFKHRPRPIKLDVYNQRKKIIGEQAQLLLKAQDEMQNEVKALSKSARNTFNKKNRKIKAREAEFKRDVLLLEHHYRMLEDSYRNSGGNPLWQLFKAFVGFIGVFLSFFWILHLCIYIIPPIFSVNVPTRFLNDFFISIGNIPFVGIAFYALFTFWLMLCVIKGNAKLGMRILFITVHPMKMGETMMSSLVFNVGLILYASLAVSQFCNMAFADYARYTASQIIFLASIRNLRELQYAYDVLLFVLLGMAVLTFVYTLYKPYTREQNKGRIVDIKF
ncbi:hypothetical protein RI367_008055 [Sorochytrium milnesiophthora]